MKRITKGVFTLVLGALLIACAATKEPNETVEKAFVKKFGKVESVKWTRNADYSYAHFVFDGKPVVAVFGNDGQYIETDLAKPIPQ